jgi:regulator of replication initiation timing
LTVRAMQIDMSISLGSIITLVGVFVTVLTWGNSVRFQVTSINEELKDLKKQVDKITEIIITTNALTNELNYLKDRLSRIERIILNHSADERKS